jgi:hypothetical protein
MRRRPVLRSHSRNLVGRPGKAFVTANGSHAMAWLPSTQSGAGSGQKPSQQGQHQWAQVVATVGTGIPQGGNRSRCHDPVHQAGVAVSENACQLGRL